MIDAWKKRGEKGLICKLDIEKAYDSINWQFLMKVMQKIGVWFKVVELDVVLHFHSQVLSPGEQSSNWFLLNFEGAAPRGPSFPLSLCHGNGSVERFNQKGYGRGFYFRV